MMQERVNKKFGNPRLHTGRRVSAEKREAILDTAYKSFSAHGLNVSVEKIAKDAGVAKQTIYNSFTDKRQLFTASIDHAKEKVTKILLDGSLEDPSETLTHIAEEYCHLSLNTAGLNMLSHLLTSREESRNKAEKAYNAGPGDILSQLAQYLERCTLEGKLKVKNPFLAADFFMGSLKGCIRERYWLKMIPPPSDKELQARINYAVELFLIAHKV